MNIRYVTKMACFLLAVSLCLLTSESVLAKKGGNGGGGGSQPVQYSVTQIPFPDGFWTQLGGTDIATNSNGVLQVVGTVRDAAGNSQAILYMDGSIFTLNNLVDALDPLARDGWNIHRAGGVNQSGQISGYAEKDGEYNAFRFDLVADPPFVLLPKPPGLEGIDTWAGSINNNGDIQFTGGGFNFVNSGSTGLNTLVSTGSKTGITDRDGNGNILAVVPGPASFEGSVFTVHPDSGTVSGSEYLSSFTPSGINNLGILSGATSGKRNANVAARYVGQVEILKNGRKDVSGIAESINSQGDVGIDRPAAIYTDQHGYLALEDLIHPDHLATYQQDFNWYKLAAIGEPAGTTGFFPILVAAYPSDGLRTLLLTPIEP